MYSSTLTSRLLDEGGWTTSRPGRFTPGKDAVPLCIEGWLGPKAGLDGCGKSHPYRDSIPGPSTP
jgi:hypothetical protein